MTTDRMFCAPYLSGYCPVTMPLRVGAQTPVWVKARVNRAPSLASRSMFGVIASLQP